MRKGDKRVKKELFIGGANIINTINQKLVTYQTKHRNCLIFIKWSSGPLCVCNVSGSDTALEVGCVVVGGSFVVGGIAFVMANSYRDLFVIDNVEESMSALFLKHHRHIENRINTCTKLPTYCNFGRLNHSNR